jgi:hypothetical protein
LGRISVAFNCIQLQELNMSSPVKEKFTMANKIRQDGVYIQFITSPIVSQYHESGSIAYNIFRVIGAPIMARFINRQGQEETTYGDQELSGSQTLFRFGSYYDNLYRTDFDPKKQSDREKMCTQLGLTNLANPLITAEEIAKLSVESLSKLVSNSEAFGPWMLTSRIWSDHDEDLGKSGHLKDCDKNCLYEHHSSKFVGYANSNVANAHEYLYHGKSSQVISGFDDNTLKMSPRHPYVFFPTREESKVTFKEWESYHKRWKVVHDKWTNFHGDSK